MREHTIRMTGCVSTGYVLTEWVGFTRVKGIASYAAQDVKGDPCGIEARGMAYRHGAGLAETYGARFVVADQTAVLPRRLGAGTACDPSRVIASDPAGAEVCRAIRASYAVSPYRCGGPRRRPAGVQRIGGMCDWLPACVLMRRR